MLLAGARDALQCELRGCPAPVPEALPITGNSRSPNRLFISVGGRHAQCAQGFARMRLITQCAQ
eukprot:110578-Rhodomonas_salina.2